MLEDSVKDDTNFSLDALLQSQTPNPDLSQNFGSKLHKDSEPISSHHGITETDDHLLGKRSSSDPSLLSLLSQIQHLQASLAAADLLNQTHAQKLLSPPHGPHPPPHLPPIPYLHGPNQIPQAQTQAPRPYPPLPPREPKSPKGRAIFLHLRICGIPRSILDPTETWPRQNHIQKWILL